MIRISHVPIPLTAEDTQLKQWAAKALGISPKEIGKVELLRKSIDARKKGNIHYVCTLRCTVSEERRLLHRNRNPHITKDTTQEYTVPKPKVIPKEPPLIVGMGPAGLFCALALSHMGVPSILVERGRPVEARTKDVERFFQTGCLDPSSNVQFGEGGAGTFSDGKLTTGIGDPRISWVLKQFVSAGAPEDILYQQKPHIGTDILRQVVQNIRKQLEEKGCTFLYEHRLVGLQTEGDLLKGAFLETPESTYFQKGEQIILAPGHSARDTMEMLYQTGIAMEPKPFAIGVRAEHWQEAISCAQYGDAASLLPPSDYKLSCHLPSGRSVFSFCVCPGGSVVAAASEPGRLVTNGMSLRARDGKIINGGILVNVTPSDFASSHPLSGIVFQRKWEEAAFRLGGGGFRAPAQRLADFLENNPSQGPGAIAPTYQPGVTWTNLHHALPPFVAAALQDAFPLFARKVKGFDDPDTVLTGIESRSSSPLRILRDHTLQSNLKGLYPCGEGAGYAGGIMSAAVDGIRCAEAVCHVFQGGNRQKAR